MQQQPTQPTWLANQESHQDTIDDLELGDGAKWCFGAPWAELAWLAWGRWTA
jgi:hypothetical protein